MARSEVWYLRTSEWHLSRHRNAVGSVSVGGCRRRVWSSQPSLLRAAPRARWLAPTGCRRAGSAELLARCRVEGEAAFWPRSRRPKTSPDAVDGGHGRADRPDPQGADRGRAGRRPGHHRLAPGPPPRPHRVAGHDRPLPDPGRAGRRGAAQAAPLLLPPVRRPTCPTSAGSRTSPTTGWPTAPTSEILVLAGRPRPLRPDR